ncbi:MAG: family 43 glycosylhydrolase [Bacteroidales bacterium]|nr:family 43 glycosylhydrolase [Bacteroidales bacterium]
MEKIIICIQALLCTIGIINAQNPIICDQFTADPTARVFEGKIYVYPSHDIPSPIDRLKEWFCMADYHVFSSENMVDWKDHGVIVSQENVPWVAPESYSMWAPDCVYKDGKYYFYFPSIQVNTEGHGFTVGVATSNKPYGPFTPQEEPIKGIQGIDPCVLIDKDGQSYIYWSGRGMWMAKLKDNMLELASEPQQVGGLPEGFKEGPFVFERQGKYYYTFPWVQEKTETLAYAIGDSPMGPFEFKGLIMDAWLSECWTNHHSIVEYKDQWYLFYHHNDFSPEFDKNRSVRVDSLFFNTDGTIQKVIPTFRGVGITDAGKEIQIDRYSNLSYKGTTIDFLDNENKFEGWKIILNENKAWVQYDSVDFGDAKQKKIKARVLSPTGAMAQLRLNGQNSPVVAEMSIPQNSNWMEVTTPVENLSSGIHNIYLSLSGDGYVEIDWIRFE